MGAATCALVGSSEKQQYAVIGFDLASQESLWKIGDFNCGVIPISCGDLELSAAFDSTFVDRRSIATDNLRHVDSCDVLIVAINLDVQKRYESDGELSYHTETAPYLKCVEEIGRNISPSTLVILESTVPVGLQRTKYSRFLRDVSVSAVFH